MMQQYPHSIEILGEKCKYLPAHEVVKKLIALQKKYYFHGSTLTDKLADILLDRNEPLIELFLAEHSKNSTILENLYRKSNSNYVKFACLNNYCSFCWGFEKIFLSKIEIEKIFSENMLLAKALALNSNINEEVIEHITSTGAKALNGNNEKDKHLWISYLHYLLIENKSQNTFVKYSPCPYDSSGYVHYLWQLLESLPVDFSTVRLLSLFIEQSNKIFLMQNDEKIYRDMDFKFEEDEISLIEKRLRNIFKKWDIKNEKPDEKYYHENIYDMCFRLRVGLAQKIVLHEPWLNFNYENFFAQSTDLAMRIGYYRSFIFQEETSLKYYTKDGPHFVQAIIDGKHSRFPKSCKNIFITWLNEIEKFEFKQNDLKYSLTRAPLLQPWEDDEKKLSCYFMDDETEAWLNKWVYNENGDKENDLTINDVNKGIQSIHDKLNILNQRIKNTSNLLKIIVIIFLAYLLFKK